MKKLLISLALCLAIWVQVQPPTKLCKKAYAYVENPKSNYALILASLEQYEWGWYWRVWKSTSSPMVAMRDGLFGTEKTIEEAKKKIWFQLLGSRII